MSKIEALEKRIAELEAEVAKLKLNPPQYVIHHHYTQPIYQQPVYQPPFYQPAPWPTLQIPWAAVGNAAAA